MVDGVTFGQFVPKAADSSSGFLINSCLTPCTPRPYPLMLDMLFAPLYVLLHRFLKGQIEAKTLEILAPALQMGPALRKVRTKQSGSAGWLCAIAIAVFAAATAYVCGSETSMIIWDCMSRVSSQAWASASGLVALAVNYPKASEYSINDD